MNIQAMMKQAQKLQKDMMSAKEEIDKTEFTGTSAMVTVRLNGAKKLLEAKINAEQLEKEDIEALEDMIVVAMNDALKQIDEVTEQKLGKYTQGMQGLF